MGPTENPTRESNVTLPANTLDAFGNAGAEEGMTDQTALYLWLILFGGVLFGFCFLFLVTRWYTARQTKKKEEALNAASYNPTTPMPYAGSPMSSATPRGAFPDTNAGAGVSRMATFETIDGAPSDPQLASKGSALVIPAAGANAQKRNSMFDYLV